ncbi:MAG: hypothetical protein ABH850_01695 [Candidatus Micrarchaeota archaeon]
MCSKSAKEEIRLIKINDKDKVKGFYTLLTNGSVRCLPDQKYIVPKYCLDVLDKEKIQFEVIRNNRK